MNLTLKTLLALNLTLISPVAMRQALAQSSAQQSSVTVTGVVTDDAGEPIIGATVKVPGTTKGSITDLDGKYTIQVPRGTAIEVSYVGYATQKFNATDTRHNVVLLEDKRSLEEVVVVGYGSVKKSNLTSSISKISSNALEDRPVTNVSEAMQGQLAGVNAQAASGGVPGQELTMRIRGVNTINGDSSPLYVIDGVPRDNMSGINPNDISSIQILKDAAATAIYGSRGANGVVLIETKEGSGKPTVAFNAYYGVQSPEKKLDLMSGYEYIAYNMFMRNASHLREGGSMSDPMTSRTMGNRIPGWWSTTNDFTDWQSEVLRTAPIQSYDVSASASGSIGNIYASFGYLNQQGIVRNTNFKRYNTRVNGELNITKSLRVGANLSFSRSEQNAAGTTYAGGGGGGKESALHHSLMTSPLVGIGKVIRTDDNPSGNLASTESSTDFGSYWIDPLAQLAKTKDVTYNNRVQSNLWGEWNILPSLTYKLQYSQNYDGEEYDYFQPASVNVSGYASAGNSHSSHTTTWVLQNTLTFDQQFKAHHLNVLLGQSAEKDRTYLGSMAALGWPYENIATLNVASTPTTASTTITPYRNMSYFGRVSYNYDDRYLLTASIRRDGSSRFGQDSKWGTFPSFSAGWKINQESFMKNVKWIDLLKLRASYGTSGNDRIGNFAYLAQLGTYYAAYGEAKNNGAAASNIANPDLKWEQTGSLDIGFDFSAFHNRVQFNFDFYSNTTTNLLFDVPVPAATGFNSQLTNIGKIRNTGWEIDLTTHNIVGLFKWTSNLNLSHNSNKVLALGGNQTRIISKLHNDFQFITEVGGPVSAFYDYIYDGVLSAEDIANGVAIRAGEQEGNAKIVDMKKDGKITDEDRVNRGSALPDLTWGFTNRFSYKNFELSILLQGQFGGKVYYVGSRHNDAGGNYNRRLFANWFHCYIPDNLKAAIPTEYLAAHGLSMDWDGKTSNPFNWGPQDNIYSATYFRVKNITLSYSFPKRLLAKTPFTSLRVYASADNVVKFDGYKGFTTETNTYGNGTTQLGVDYSTYPLSRRFTLGLNVTF